MPFTPYLSFQGQAAEAFAFYGKVFGAMPQLNHFSDIPPGAGPDLPPAQQAWVMHAQIDGPDGTLMGADMPPQFGGKPQSGVSIAVTRDDEDAARTLFDTLAAGGVTTMPFSQTFFAKGFGMCTDRFGTSWMVSFGMTDDGEAK